MVSTQLKLFRVRGTCWECALCFNSANLEAYLSQEPVLCVQGLIALVLYQFVGSMDFSLNETVSFVEAPDTDTDVCLTQSE